MLVPRILEQIVEVIKMTLQERPSKRIVKQTVDVPEPQVIETTLPPSQNSMLDVRVPKIPDEIVEVIRLVPREHILECGVEQTVDISVPKIRRR